MLTVFYIVEYDELEGKYIALTPQMFHRYLPLLSVGASTEAAIASLADIVIGQVESGNRPIGECYNDQATYREYENIDENIDNQLQGEMRFFT